MNKIIIIKDLLKEVDKTIFKELFKTTNLKKVKKSLENLPDDELLYLNKNIWGGK